MSKKIWQYGFLVVPCALVLTAILMLIRPGATFQFHFNTTVDAYPGSVFDFIFGFSADRHVIVQTNIVGVFMLLLLMISGVLPFVGKRLRNPYGWTGVLLTVSAVLMVVHPFLSLIGSYYLDQIELAQSFEIPIYVTYSIQIPLILSALLLMGGGVFAFLLAKKKCTFSRQLAELHSQAPHKKSHPRKSVN